jgi:aryl-alcohol dehydrogenase-like predicted oxidoreductase
LAAQPGVVAPIASARTTGQVPPLLKAMDIRLTDAELQDLDDASQALVRA